MTLRISILLSLTLLLSACQLLEERWEAEHQPEAVPVDEADGLADGPGRLPRAIDHLQDGEHALAEELLVGLLEDHPDNRLAARLLSQLHEAPESFLGEEFMQVVVAPGDTLSGLAQRHAGDGMLFVALARLNAIDRPRLLRPGTVLRVPAVDQEPDESGENTATTAPRQSGGESPDGGEPESLPDPIEADRLEQEAGEVAAARDLVDRYHERALKAWRAQEVNEAVTYWERVLELDPDFEPAQVYLERARDVQQRLDELERL